MRIKIRLPSAKSAVLCLSDNATVGDLLDQALDLDELKATDGIEFKSGFPPKPLDTSTRSAELSSIGIKSGDQLIVTLKTVTLSSLPQGVANLVSALGDSYGDFASSKPVTFKGTSGSDKIQDETLRPPEASCGPDNVVVLRVMEDDNSCLFRAIGYVMFRNLDTMHELRSLVASYIHDNPEEYPDVVLGRPRQEYCQWITKSNSWGGAIEIAILAKHFDVSICSMDVATSRIDTFNPGQATFVVVVYSGIHYDAVALAPAGVEGMADFDQTVFNNDATGNQVLDSAKKLLAQLKERHYFTDVANFSTQCADCGVVLTGEKQAEVHSKKTGHQNFQEISG
ncbi:hypothetical protein V1514DRAFT_337825 [Lipomyces japonicus]|uniref:uncharacterized protein n=1 Tax=Lipomyces japonicus TaxID=56871 RepID=UPI0034CFDA4F